jgi:hypothetical protein
VAAFFRHEDGTTAGSWVTGFFESQIEDGLIGLAHVTCYLC